MDDGNVELGYYHLGTTSCHGNSERIILVEHALQLFTAASSLFSSCLLNRLETSITRRAALFRLQGGESSSAVHVGDIGIDAWEKAGEGIEFLGSARASYCGGKLRYLVSNEPHFQP